MDRPRVTSREELIDHIFRLLDDYDAVGDQWESKDIDTDLQAIAAWLEDSKAYIENAEKLAEIDNPSWQLFADALWAGSRCE